MAYEAHDATSRYLSMDRKLWITQTTINLVVFLEGAYGVQKVVNWGPAMQSRAARLAGHRCNMHMGGAFLGNGASLPLHAAIPFWNLCQKSSTTR